jgi:hypothetical protein
LFADLRELKLNWGFPTKDRQQGFELAAFPRHFDDLALEVFERARGHKDLIAL